MLNGHRYAAQGRRLFLPTGHRRAPAFAERLPVRLIRRRIAAIELRHARRQRFTGLEDVARIGLDVRIAGGMDVALGAIEPRRHIEHAHISGGFEGTRLAGLDTRIARFAQHDRQPAHLQLGAGRHHQIGAAGARDQRRPRLDVVRVLQAIGGGKHIDFVATDHRSQRAPFGHGGEDFQFGPGRQSQQGEQRKNDRFHD